MVKGRVRVRVRVRVKVRAWARECIDVFIFSSALWYYKCGEHLRWFGKCARRIT